MAHVLGRRAVAPEGRSRIWLAVGLALAGLLVVSVMGVGVDPALARTCGTVTIQNGTADPGSGTTVTKFAFGVTFVNSTGAAPQSVRLQIAGTWMKLAPTGSKFASGVRYVGSRKLPAGTWTYIFRATYGDGQTCDHMRVTPPNVTVGPAPTPKPTPKPTPRPTPKPTPKPTPRPAPKPKVTAKPAPPKATPKPAQQATPVAATPSAEPVVQASASPSPIVAVIGGAGSSPGTGSSSSGGGGGGELSFVGDPLADGPPLAVPLLAVVSAIVGWFLLLARRRSGRGPSPAAGGIDGGAMALAGVPLGPPPVLLPAAIFRQVLFDTAELTPEWAKPRPTPGPFPVPAHEPLSAAVDAAAADVTAVADAAPSDEPTPATPARRRKSPGSSGASQTRSKRAKPDNDAASG